MRRRDLVLAGLSLPAAAALWQFSGRGSAAPFTPVCSAATNAAGEPLVGAIQGQGLAFSLPSPARGHDSCIHPQRAEALFFARRPGTHLYVVNLLNGELIYGVEARRGFHFYGHGCLSRDGAHLYTTENHVAASGRGAIGVYDCNDGYRCLGHIDCRGIGPHELALMPDGEQLVVAMGGIKTLPQTGRKTLNPGALQPGLAYIDLARQQLSEFLPSPDPQLSLRHLAVNPQGDVIVGGQHQGPLPSSTPLIYHHRPGQALRALDTPAERPMRYDYVASVATDNSDGVLCTFPKDNQLGLWSISRGQLIRRWQLRDCAGACFDARHQQFIVSSSSGQLMAARADSEALVPLAYMPSIHWDNHLSSIPAALADILPRASA